MSSQSPSKNRSSSDRRGSLRKQVPLGRAKEGVHSYGIVLHHPGNGVLLSGTVEHELPEGFIFRECHPAGHWDGQRISWECPTFEDGQIRRYRVSAQPAEGLETYPDQPMTFEVELTAQPIVEVSLSKPEPVEVNDTIRLEVQLRNQGQTTAAAGVVLCRITPESDWAKPKTFKCDFGAIPPSEERVVRIQTIATHPGEWGVKAWVGGEGNTRSVAHTQVTVAAPGFNLILHPPEPCPLGEQVIFGVELYNAGGGECSAEQVVLSLPEEAACLTSGEGSYDPATHQVAWRLEALRPRARFRGVVEIRVDVPGEVEFLAEVGDGGGLARASTRVRVELPREREVQILDPLLARLAGGASELPVGGDLPVLVPPTDEEATERYVVISVGESEWAILLADVAEIGQPGAVTPLPTRVPWLGGVINWRGEVITVLEMSVLLGVNDRPGQDRHLVVVRDAGTPLGLLVDRVIGLRRLPIAVPSEPVITFPACCQGLTYHDDVPVPVLDPTQLLTSDQFTHLGA